MTEANDDQVVNEEFKDCSYSAIATAIFLITTNELKGTQCEYSHDAIVRILPTPTQPIVSKNLS